MTRLRLAIFDTSAVARQLFERLFADLPGYDIEFGGDLSSLLNLKRRAKPHVVIFNTNVLPPELVAENLSEALAFVDAFPTLCLVSPERLEIKAFLRQHPNVVLLEKPFYPYDVISIVNRLVHAEHRSSSKLKPPPAPRRRRLGVGRPRKKP